jgi:hypothetical protein
MFFRRSIETAGCIDWRHQTGDIVGSCIAELSEYSLQERTAPRLAGTGRRAGLLANDSGLVATTKAERPVHFAADWP